MAFLSCLSDFEKPSNSFEMSDRLDSAESCAFPSTAELCKAVSASLGLDPASSPVSNMNQSFSGIGHTVYGLAAESGSELESTRDVSSEGSIPPGATDRCEEDFGEVRQYAVSCVELLGPGQVDIAPPVSRAPVISRFVRKDSNLFTTPAGEVPPPTLASELIPPQPYNAHASNPRIYPGNPAVWRTFSGEAEPERPGGYNMLCKYCNCGQTSNGSGLECRCVWYSDGEQGGKNGSLAAVAPEFGQVEMYKNAKSQGQSAYSIKTEPPVWVDWTDHKFRYMNLANGSGQIFISALLSLCACVRACGAAASNRDKVKMSNRPELFFNTSRSTCKATHVRAYTAEGIEFTVVKKNSRVCLVLRR